MQFSQELSTVLACVTFPAPPATRGFYLVCLMRLGGCAVVVSGGIPTVEQVMGYDPECRRETGYTGAFEMPSDQDCGRWAGSGP